MILGHGVKVRSKFTQPPSKFCKSVMGRSNRDQNGKVFPAPRPSWTVLVVKGWICRCKEAILTGSCSVPGAVCQGRRKFVVMVQDTDFGLARLPARQASGRFPRGRHFLMFIVCVTVLLGRSCERLARAIILPSSWYSSRESREMGGYSGFPHFTAEST